MASIIKTLPKHVQEADAGDDKFLWRTLGVTNSKGAKRVAYEAMMRRRDNAIKEAGRG